MKTQVLRTDCIFRRKTYKRLPESRVLFLLNTMFRQLEMLSPYKANLRIIDFPLELVNDFERGEKGKRLAEFCDDSYLLVKVGLVVAL